MHRLQQHILHQLIVNTNLRYARLKPAEVEGNLFMYHLKQLINEDLVQKGDDGLYCLTGKGQTYADRLSLKNFQPRVQPRIVTLIALQNDKEEWLMYRRKRQPLLGRVGFPYGKIHLGETILQAAHRELEEKTGLSAKLTHRGDGYATIYEQGEPVSQIFFHLFLGCNPSGQLVQKSKVGEAFWSLQKDFDQLNLMPTVPDILKLLHRSGPQHFFTELVYT